MENSDLPEAFTGPSSFASPAHVGEIRGPILRRNTRTQPVQFAQALKAPLLGSACDILLFPDQTGSHSEEFIVTSKESREILVLSSLQNIRFRLPPSPPSPLKSAKRNPIALLNTVSCFSFLPSVPSFVPLMSHVFSSCLTLCSQDPYALLCPQLSDRSPVLRFTVKGTALLCFSHGSVPPSAATSATQAAITPTTVP